MPTRCRGCAGKEQIPGAAAVSTQDAGERTQAVAKMLVAGALLPRVQAD
jgi:hypothetical protein